MSFPRKPSVDQGEDPIFRPEAYGTVDGADASVDMPLVQTAIDAAGVAGGTVRLDQTYAVLEQASIQCGLYSNVYYGAWCNYDDVIIDGNGTGTLLLEAMPATATNYAMLLVGDGGYQAGGWPGLEWLLANGNIPRRNKIRDLAFDASVLTVPNIATLSAFGSGVLQVYFCQDFEIDGVTVDQGFGTGGGISCGATCRDFVVKNCTVDAAYRAGFFGDGAKNAEYDNCSVGGDVDPAILSHGISIATSGDYHSYSENVNVHDCTIVGTWDGIAISGEEARVIDCAITLKDQNATRMGITVTVGYSAARDCDSDGNAIVTGNTIQRPVGATWEKGYGVYLAGLNAGYGGSPLRVYDCEIHTNHVLRMTFGLALGTQAHDNIFTENTIEDCVGVDIDVSGDTANGNVISDNTVI